MGTNCFAKDARKLHNDCDTRSIVVGPGRVVNVVEQVADARIVVAGDDIHAFGLRCALDSENHVCDHCGVHEGVCNRTLYIARQRDGDI